MAGTKQVRIVGSDDLWEVICETDKTMVLVNQTSRLMRDANRLESELADIRRVLEAARQATKTDVSGNPIEGP